MAQAPTEPTLPDTPPETPIAPQDARKFRAYTRRDFDKIPQLDGLSTAQRDALRAVAAVFPFRVNQYVVDELIDWSRTPDDPMFRLTFPQPDMLSRDEFGRMYRLVRSGAAEAELMAAAREIQATRNPHPSGQALNVPSHEGVRLTGLQHKYRETVLFFPAAGQTCHAYCAYCFRWPQFVGLDEIKFAEADATRLVGYLRDHHEVRSIILTGGDPMVMKTRALRRYVEPLLDDDLAHVQSIRIGTKAPAYWPHRFVTDDDADDLLRLFESVVSSGRALAIMAHYSHPRELETPIAQEALRRIRSTGATVRTQAPVIRHVNDDAETWARLWSTQVRHGAFPYYFFVERDTGPRDYFEVPLARALEIYQGAIRGVDGLARTARGPTMSATAGKILLDGITRVEGERVFALRFLQARVPEWNGQVFFARYDPDATWFDDLEPAHGRSEFFFDAELRQIKREAGAEERRRLRIVS